MRKWTSLVLFAALAAGCDDTVTPPPPTPDMTANTDGAGPPPDLAVTGMDMPAPQPDIATTPADLEMADLMNPGPAPTVIAHGDWLSFCQAFTSCGLYPPSIDLSSCARQQPVPGSLSFAPRSILACLANAGADCTKVKVCLNDGNVNYDCNSDAGVQATCSNDVYTLCQRGGFKFAVDCMKLGFACVSVPDPNMPNPSYSGCGFGTCALDGGVGNKYCVSGFVSNCNAGGRLYATEDCRVFDNEECEVSDGGAASCVGTGAACTTAKCDGTVMVSCKGGHEARFDCQQQNLLCVDRGNGNVSCGLGTQCDPATYSEICVGNVLTYCDLGLLKTIDCVAAGWKSCVPRMKPDGGTATGGYCSAM